MLAKERRDNGQAWSESYLYRKQLRQGCMGEELHTGIMILALAMGHTVERPVMGMGGGTIKPMERLPAAV